MSYIWMILIILRLGWSLLPQTGYIHPDEFFQTVEVVAGDALNISVERTWEFTSTHPLRSAVLPQLIFHPIFKLLKYIDESPSFYVTGFHLVASYRLLMTLLSLWLDLCVYKICEVIRVQGHTANLLLASSYVTLTFQTHTFSNSFETLLFTTLIWLILICMRKEDEKQRKQVGTKFFTEIDKFLDSSELSRMSDDREDNEMSEEDLDSSFNDLHKNAFNLRKRNQQLDKQFEKERRRNRNRREELNYEHRKDSGSSKTHAQNRQKSDSETNCIGDNNLYTYMALLAVCITVGVFNRPTFVIFAALPLLWLANKHPTGEIYVFKRAAVFIFIGILFTFIFVTMDTLYFSGMDIASLLTTSGWRKVFENCVITPLNFFLYNSMSGNLATHGYHPFYVHFLVNMPLLFGPMLAYLTSDLLKDFLNFLKIVKKDNKERQDGRSDAKKTTTEDGNLKTEFKGMLWIFIFVPVALLSCFPHQEARFLIPLLPLVVLSVVIFSNKIRKIFWTGFIIFNIFLSVVFGALHQGGVIPSLIRLQQLTEMEFKQNKSITMTVIFSHTYMPPKHVLMTSNPNLELIDLKGDNFHTVLKEIEKHKKMNTTLTGSEVHESMNKVFLVLPGSLVTEFKTKCNKMLGFGSEEKFFPHVSFEDPPDLRLINSYKTLVDLMSLYLIEIE